MDDHSLISAVDWLPTFCEIADVELQEGYPPEGASQVETLRGEPAPLRETPLFWKYPTRWPPKNHPNHWVPYAVVHQHWKLVSHQDGGHKVLSESFR